MGIKNERLWEILEEKASEEDNSLGSDQRMQMQYIAGIETICEFAIERAILIRDTFPMYTLHDETHICNVMRLMVNLLGPEGIQSLTRDEAAMLVLAACCHDIGMSYSNEEKENLFDDLDRFNQYLDQHHSEYIKAYAGGRDVPVMTDEIAQNYLRSIHHERVAELLRSRQWPAALEGKVDREDVISVCQSHCRETSTLDTLDQTPTVDLRFCAVLLRLADILDFDTSRAPQAVYDYTGFNHKKDPAATISKGEWQKHMASHGFDFQHVADRSYPYELNYHATSRTMQIEQSINCFLDWVDQELGNCGKQIKRFAGKWQALNLPGRIKRNIISEGYVSGQYRLTLDQDRIMELLVGKELYSDPAVFVRELIQNAIDAVRTREKLDKNLPPSWTPQINIRCWMDEDGYHWFRIEDNGIGMTGDVIMNYFLKIGRSYYTSDTFQLEKLRCRADPDYTPISRFGIGILSCFMGDKRTTQVEVSTKRFNEDRIYYPALRLSMHGINGYYYLADKNKDHSPGPMKGVTPSEQRPYRNQAGTIIAVRTNLYLTGNYRGFKEIVDRYVVYPAVAIHYDGPEGSFDYPTESEFMTCIHSIQPSDDITKKGMFEFPLSEEQLKEMSNSVPELSFEAAPKVLLKCAALDSYTKSPYLTGALLTAAAVGSHEPIEFQFGERRVKANVCVGLEIDSTRSELDLRITLDFPSEFEHYVDALARRKVDREQYLYELFASCRNDYMQAEIIDGMIRNYLKDTRWQKYIAQRFSISRNELNKIIKTIKQKFYETSGFSFDITEEDTQIVQAFEGHKHAWRFTVCKLSAFDWYKKYFYTIRNSSGYYGAAAHNGVLCGDASSFIPENNHRENLGTIILLKDAYRPVVDVARDGIRSITPEMVCDFEIIRKRINSQGFALLEGSSFFRSTYKYTPAKSFWELLDQRPDWASQLVVRTTQGDYSLSELSQALRNHQELELRDARDYVRYIRGGLLYDTMCIAFLEKEFSLRIVFEKTISASARVYVVERTKEDSEFYNSIKELPTMLFAFPYESSCPYLAAVSGFSFLGYNIIRIYNANHPLSQFIISNRDILKKYVPGVFREIFRILQEDEKNELIRNMNDLLSHLRSVPRGLINVPAELSLSEKDFLY